MVLFAHFSKGISTVDLETTIISSLIQGSVFGGQQTVNGVETYFFDNGQLKVEVKKREDESDLITIILNLEGKGVKQRDFDNFRVIVDSLATFGFANVSDYELQEIDDEFSLYWTKMWRLFDNQRLKINRANTTYIDSLSVLIGPEPYITTRTKASKETKEINIEFEKVKYLDSLEDLMGLKFAHFHLLNGLAKIINYVDVSKRTGSKPDLKIGARLDDVIELACDLLPSDHNNLFADFIYDVIERDQRSNESLYRTLDTIHSAAILLRRELSKKKPKIPRIINDIKQYGPISAVVRLTKKVGSKYGRVQVDKILKSKYSECNILRSLVDIEKSTSNFNSELSAILDLIFTHGDFQTYLISKEGEKAKRIIRLMHSNGFNIEQFRDNNLSIDILTRQKDDSIISWENNFDRLVEEFKQGQYNVFFMQYNDDGKTERINQQIRNKVLGLSSQNGLSYILSKVSIMLNHCRTRQKDKKDKGRKIDQPLIELEERLENLKIQLEFGGRPTGGMIYTKVWHRVIEDFSREDLMLCCACLNGEKQDLTFKAIFNPTYIYLNHFIEGIDHHLGFSIIKAGMSQGKRVLLAISPYEANPAIRTALREKETYQYVLDAMIKSSLFANVDYLLIDDIDLKVRDESGNSVRHIEKRIVKIGEQGYDEGQEVYIRYRNEEPCAPRSFRKFMERITGKHISTITYEDVNFEQIGGDDELVQEQFGKDQSHYSIQSANHIYDSSIDYFNLSNSQTKQIFDQGYKPQNGIRTVFKVDVKKYLEERKSEGVDLIAKVSTIDGNQRN